MIAVIGNVLAGLGVHQPVHGDVAADEARQAGVDSRGGRTVLPRVARLSRERGADASRRRGRPPAAARRLGDRLAPPRVRRPRRGRSLPPAQRVRPRVGRRDGPARGHPRRRGRLPVARVRDGDPRRGRRRSAGARSVPRRLEPRPAPEVGVRRAQGDAHHPPHQRPRRRCSRCRCPTRSSSARSSSR